MVVSATASHGSVGGGNLEWQATAHARALLAGQALPLRVRYALGASLGQCCGGEVVLEFALHTDRAAALAVPPMSTVPTIPVAVFGAGHVGQALVRLLVDLPVQLHWLDSRAETEPNVGAPGLVVEQVEPLHDAVADLVPGSHVLILTHSHAQDLELVGACLQRHQQRADLPFIGLIGSATKWTAFQQRLRARGYSDAALSHVTCPIGIPGLSGKQPAVIAVAVAAQLLQRAA